ncbi:MAG: sensor histidine kinase, partial [Chitinophagaceae bacterium]
CGLLAILTSLGFFWFNLLNHQVLLMMINLLNVFWILVVLYFQYHKKLVTARYLFSFWITLIFTLVPLKVHNGAEYFLITNILITPILFEKRRNQLLIILLNMACFCFVKGSLGEWGSILQPYPYFRNLLNLVIFLLFLLVLIFFHHQEENNYRRQLESVNDELARKNASLEMLNNTNKRILSIVAHDLRTPIGNVKNMVFLLKGKGISEVELDHLLENMEKRIDHLTIDLENTLKWASLEFQGEVEPLQKVNLFEIARDTLFFFKENLDKKNLQIINEIKPGVTIEARRDQVVIILRNLISNAQKFTPRGGWIKISAYEMGATCQLEIADSGVGMDPALINRILQNDPLSSRSGTENEPGTGLGLLIIRDMVKKNLGTMEIKSKIQVGTSFLITFQSMRQPSSTD